MNLLRIEEVSKKYPGNQYPVLNQLSFTIEEGKTYAFIGENGAGKTTLLRALCGLTDIDEGAIFFNDALLEGPSNKLVAGHPQIKMLRQDATLYPKMTVYENISYELKSYQPEFVSARMQELLHLCNLEGLEKKYPAEISGGQKQKAALARALADQPDLIVLDEPFSNADVMQKYHLKKTLSEIFKRTNTTLLFSSHDIEEALSLSENIICMKDGRIVQMGSPEDIYFRPYSSYVANLAGVCNYFPARKLPFSNSLIPDAIVSVRAEDIFTCTEAEAYFKGEIIGKFFLGMSYEYTLHAPDNVELVFYAKENFSRGKVVFIKFNRENLMYFENA